MCRKRNMKLNPSKFKVARRVEFGGVTLSASQVNGKALVEMEANTEKIEALLEMDKPTNVRQAKQVLGMVNQLSRWVPRLSLSIPNLKKSTSARTRFQWSEVLDMEWVRMMEMLRETVKLSPMDTELPLELYTDASYGGIGYYLVEPRGGGSDRGEQ